MSTDGPGRDSVNKSDRETGPASALSEAKAVFFASFVHSARVNPLKNAACAGYPLHLGGGLWYTTASGACTPSYSPDLLRNPGRQKP
jgi:hypothetical protein